MKGERFKQPARLHQLIARCRSEEFAHLCFDRYGGAWNTARKSLYRSSYREFQYFPNDGFCFEISQMYFDSVAVYNLTFTVTRFGHDAVSSVDGGRMGVGEESLSEFTFAILATPDLCPAGEEVLTTTTDNKKTTR